MKIIGFNEGFFCTIFVHKRSTFLQYKDRKYLYSPLSHLVNRPKETIDTRWDNAMDIFSSHHNFVFFCTYEAK